MDTSKPLTFMAAARDYFGVREGTTSLDFGKEIKALTLADRAEITAGLEKEGYTILAAPGATA
jgi:hypothetical protein